MGPVLRHLDIEDSIVKKSDHNPTHVALIVYWASVKIQMLNVPYLHKCVIF